MFEDFLDKILASNSRRIAARSHGDLTDGGRRRSGSRGFGGRGYGGRRNVVGNNTGVEQSFSETEFLL